MVSVRAVVFATLVSVVLCSSSRAQDASAPLDARVHRFASRLESLSPEEPGLYFELGEEVHAVAANDEERGLARRLYVLALATGLEVGDRAVAGGACLGLAQLARTEQERRWLRSLAHNADPRIELAQEGASSGASEAAIELSTALTRFRAGEGRIARRALGEPSVRALLARHAPDAWINELEAEARDWPCRECHNDRFVSVAGQAGRFAVCSTCGGDPGPELNRAELLDILRVEAALVDVRANAWSALLELGRDQPLREADPREIAPHFGIDPRLACWIDGRWVACPEGEPAP